MNSPSPAFGKPTCPSLPPGSQSSHVVPSPPLWELSLLALPDMLSFSLWSPAHGAESLLRDGFRTPPSSQPALPPAESDYPGEWAAGARGRGWHHLGRCPKGAPIFPRGLGAACALERCLGLRRSHRLGHCILIRGEGLSSGRGDGGGGAGLQGQRRRPPGQRFSDLRGQQDPLEEAGCELWSL